MVFTGTYEHSIDAKNRLAIPSDIRAVLQDAQAGELDRPVILYVMLGDGALSVYTEQGLQQRAGELDRSELDADELLEYERMMFSLASRVEMDGQGRVRLPEHLLKRAKLGSDVVLIGVKDHLEIRDRASWLAHVEQVLARKPGILMNPRRAMRRPPGSAPAATPGNTGAV